MSIQTTTQGSPIIVRRRQGFWARVLGVLLRVDQRARDAHRLDGAGAHRFDDIGLTPEEARKATHPLGSPW
ncbi:MAG: hypothetical protein AAFV27_05555 [Pseudomonadota bacterium]